MYPDNLRYTEDHEWIRVEGDTGVVGISHHAQEALGDIVYVELPEVGAKVDKNGSAGSIESVKAVSDVFSPVSGEIVEVNAALDGAPENINKDCYGDGWIYKIRVADMAEVNALMDVAAYKEFLKES